MEKQLDVQQLFDLHKTRQFNTLAEEFASFQEVVLQAIEQPNSDVLLAILGNYSEPFIVYGYHYEVLQFFYDIEEPIRSKCPEMLAVLYLIIGHCYYVQLNHKMAKKYYIKATNLAFEYQLYEVMSITVKNITVMDMNLVPDEALFESSKMSVIFYLLKKTEDEPNFIYRIITHVECAIRTKRFDYATQLLERFASPSKIVEKSRIWYQIKGLHGDILFGKGRYEEAQIIYHEVLMNCVEGNYFKDIIIYCYEKLSQCATFLNNKKLENDIEQSSHHFLNAVESNNQQLEHYFKQKVAHLSEDRYTESREAFDQQAKVLFGDVTGQGYTLAVVEFKTVSQDEDIVEPMIEMLHTKMLKTFSENMVIYARLNKTMISYVVTMSEKEFDAEVRAIFVNIRQHYPKGASALEAMYFASVNNNDNGIDSYEKCLELANAYIYYELYK